ncbi:MAG: 1-acyl-sn-glycerol-3-phosphate acyltransferase [Ardenticatenaceae bacterium]|nr:1-acyl-sn-glycerol-3-phosphate acyltransferase [Ardenticatenaceae bacterium]HBY98986.1 1-acyl-sn-glycerol-3-phosphate acyltransferase [Chloroflexota bacterium]
MRTLPWFYYFANWMLRNVIFRLLMKVEIHGLEEVPATGPLIVVINHFNFVDPIMAGAYFPRDLEMMSKLENFELPLFGWFVKAYGAFPVRRGEGDVEAIKHALRILHEGRVLLMAPEGTRGGTVLKTGHGGVALLAARSGAPVIPVGITGQEHFLPNLKHLRRTPIRVSIGAPFHLDAGTRKPPREILQAMTEELMGRLAIQLPLEYRGEYQTLRNSERFVRLLKTAPAA